MYTADNYNNSESLEKHGSVFYYVIFFSPSSPIFHSHLLPLQKVEVVVPLVDAIDRFFI